MFTINTKNHSGQRIWVGGDTFMVSGQRKPWVRNAAHEASRARKRLSAVVGDVEVQALVVVTDPGDFTVAEQPALVTVTTARRLVRLLRDAPTVLSPGRVQEIARAAAAPSTWRDVAAPPVDTRAVVSHFETLDRDVRSAMRVRRMWQFAGPLTVVAVCLRVLSTLS